MDGFKHVQLEENEKLMSSRLLEMDRVGGGGGYKIEFQSISVTPLITKKIICKIFCGVEYGGERRIVRTLPQGARGPLALAPAPHSFPIISKTMSRSGKTQLTLFQHFSTLNLKMPSKINFG